MHDLIAFLRARLDEDEQAARQFDWYDPTRPTDLQKALGMCRPVPPATWELEPSGEYITVYIDPGRVLAECAAKRRLIGEYERALRATERNDIAAAELAADIEHQERTGEWQGAGHADVRSRAIRREADYLDAMRPILRQLCLSVAAVYADHPDYREEWRP